MRYKKVFSLPGEQYSTGCPAVIAAGALLLDQKTGATVALLKFRSLSRMRILALTVEIRPADVARRPLGDPLRFTYLDVDADRDAEFGQYQTIGMPRQETRFFSARITEVILDDPHTGIAVWNDDMAPSPLPAREPLSRRLADEELQKQFCLRYGADSDYWLWEDRDLWGCPCGAVNHSDEVLCHACGKALPLLQALDLEELAREKDERLEAERMQREETEAAARKAEAEERARIAVRRKAWMTVAGIAAGIAALILLAVNVVVPGIKYYRAENLANQREYQKAEELFRSLEDYRDSADRAEQMVFNAEKSAEAAALLEEKKYEEAYAIYDEIGDELSVAESRRERGLALLDEEKYEEAYALLSEAGDEDTVTDSLLTRARAAVESGDRETARKLLEGREGKSVKDFLAELDAQEQKEAAYKSDSDMTEQKEESMAEIEVKSLLDPLQAGDIVAFGTYEQDNDPSNGAEPIEWIVLRGNNGAVLVVSRYTLDCKPFQTPDSDVSLSWKTSYLRSWLNEDFYNIAFSVEEKEIISNSLILSSNGVKTYDRVFLLSHQRTEDLLRSENDRMCAPTEYAQARGAYKSIATGSCFWWLLTTNDDTNEVDVVGDDGSILSLADYEGSRAVRPAMWIALPSNG